MTPTLKIEIGSEEVGSFNDGIRFISWSDWLHYLRDVHKAGCNCSVTPVALQWEWEQQLVQSFNWPVLKLWRIHKTFDRERLAVVMVAGSGSTRGGAFPNFFSNWKLCLFKHPRALPGFILGELGTTQCGPGKNKLNPRTEAHVNASCEFCLTHLHCEHEIFIMSPTSRNSLLLWTLGNPVHDIVNTTQAFVMAPTL